MTTTEWLNWVKAQVLNNTAVPIDKRQLTFAADRSPIPLIYGVDRIGASVLNVLPLDANGVPYVVVQCLWAHKWTELQTIELNDAPLDPAWTVIHYDGSQTSANTSLQIIFNTLGLGAADVLNGYAYSLIYMPVNSFTGELNYSAVAKGCKVYDPRDGSQTFGVYSTYKWSDNPALCLADHLVSTVYGCGKTVDWSTVTTAANFCDELVSSEKRRTLNVTFAGAQSAAQVAETLRTYAGCFLLPGANGIKLVPDKPTPSVATYSHNAGTIVAIQRLEKRDMGNVPTVMDITYTDRSMVPWREDSAIAKVPGVDAGTVPRRESKVSLPGINRYSQAYREAVERLNKLYLIDLLMQVDVFDVGIAHELGDVITIADHPIGLSNKEFRIGDIEALGTGKWRLSCVEYDPLAYSNEVQTQPSYPDTGFTDPLVPPATPTGLAKHFGQYGVELTWNRNVELSVREYELKQGSTWGGGSPLIGTLPTIVGGTSFVWPVTAAGSYTVRLKARTTLGVESVSEATLSFSIAAPVMATLQASVVGANVQLVWSLSSSDLPIKFYRVRKAGVLVAEVNSTLYTAPIDWAGDKTFTVAAVDIGDNESTALSQTVSVAAVSAVASFTATVVVNTVLFYWQPPLYHALPIVLYRMRRGGTTWGTATPIGEKAGDQTFTTYFEGSEGTYKYWIAAVDSAGNEGTPTSIDVNVDAPPGFRLQSEWNTLAGTLTNMVTWDGEVYAPVNATETFQQHFDNNSWTTPQAQVSANLDPYLEPSQSTSTYVQTFDATGTASDLTSSLITLAYTGVVVDGNPTITPKIEIATNAAPSTWQDLGNVWQAFAAGFRYIRITLTVGSSGSDDLLRISNVNLKLALKSETDAGSMTSGDFTGSPARCSVTFNKSFIDVDSIVVTPKGTAFRIAVVDFTDAPNPTGFDVYIYNSAGTNTPTDFSWSAVGAV